MSQTVVYRREAEDEFAAAAVWYEDQREGLGVEFITRVTETINLIAERPTLFARVQGEIRRAPVRTFPYSVFYRIEPTRVLILAIVHAKRDPSIWRARI